MKINLHRSLLLLLLWIAQCLAEITSKDSLMYSCIFGSNKYHFDHVPPANSNNFFWEPLCNYDPLVGTLVYCFNEYQVDSADLDYTYDMYIDNCNEFGEVPKDVVFDRIHLEMTYNNASQFIRNASSGTNSSMILYHEPIEIDYASMDLLRTSYLNFVYNFVSTRTMASVMCAYWVVLLVIIGIFNHCKKYKFVMKYARGPYINKWRKWFTLRSFANSTYHLQPFNIFGSSFGKKYLPVFNCLLPTSQEGVILVVYFIAMFSYLCVDYRLQDVSFLLGDRQTQMARYLADRTGIMAFSQLPPLFLFGGRNNILINLSGLPFNSFIILHKWISRVMVILASLHAHFFALYFQLENVLEEEKKSWVYIIGQHALFFAVLILIFGIFHFRSRYYELFLITHIVLALLFIVGCLLHVVKIGYYEWILASMAIWALDRLMRIYNLYKFGFPEAELEIVGDAIVVTIPKPKNMETWVTHPGQFAYIHFLHTSLPFWQSHPFTFYDTTTYNILSKSSSPHCIKLYIKGKEGLTKKLFNFIEQHSDDSNILKLRVGLEGPYSHHTDLRAYDNVILFAGGNGVPGPYYHAMNLINHDYKDQTVDFVWTIKELSNLSFFYKELLQLAHVDKENKIRKLIYVTREKLPTNEDGTGDDNTNKNDHKESNRRASDIVEATPLIQNDASSSSSISNSRTASFTTPGLLPSATEMYHKLSNAFEFREGRPVFSHHINEHIPKRIHSEDDEEKQGQSLAVISCGPDLMCDQLREIVASVSGTQGHSRIDIYEELQVW